MYKIYIRKSASKKYYEPYAIEGEDYATDDLVELAEKYRELLDEYPVLQLMAVQELDTEILVEINDD